MIADLTCTEWIPAADVHVGDRLVDWHAENGLSVFGSDPEARRVVERVERDGLVRFVVVSGDGFRSQRAKKAEALVEVQR